MRFATPVPWVVAGALSLWPQPAAPQEPQFRSSVSVVRLPVVVRGRDGNLARGLTAQDFEVREDGQLQTIAHFAEGAPSGEQPLHLGLLLDASGSMEKDLDAAAGAAVRFVQALEEARDVTFVDFDTAVRVGRFMPASYPQLFERIRGTKAGGYTALYDALGVYLEGARQRDGQHVLLLYTDGGDSRSRLGFGKLLELLRLGNVLVYAIGYLENQLSTDRLTQQLRLNQIAKEAGGEAFFPQSARELNEVYARILDELVSRYTIGYVSSNPKMDGRFRRVDVRLTKPDLRSVKIRTRSGYMAPPAGGGS
jgi:Ca-activated chloride channel family protein